MIIGIFLANFVLPELAHAEAVKIDSKPLVVPTIQERVARDFSPLMVKVVTSSSVLERIAYCESGNNPLAKNPKSTAKGRFQFLKSSWEYYGKQYWGDKWIEKNVFDYENSTELAYWVFSKNGTKDWVASKSCWS